MHPLLLLHYPRSFSRQGQKLRWLWELVLVQQAAFPMSFSRGQQLGPLQWQQEVQVQMPQQGVLV